MCLGVRYFRPYANAMPQMQGLKGRYVGITSIHSTSWNTTHRQYKDGVYLVGRISTFPHQNQAMASDIGRFNQAYKVHNLTQIYGPSAITQNLEPNKPRARCYGGGMLAI